MAGGFGLIGCMVVVAAVLMGCATAETHMVGDDLGWKVPPGGPIAYSVWADKQNFEIGDTLSKYSSNSLTKSQWGYYFGEIFFAFCFMI